MVLNEISMIFDAFLTLRFLFLARYSYEHFLDERVKFMLDKIIIYETNVKIEMVRKQTRGRIDEKQLAKSSWYN